ncbi:regulator of chromosome condensation, putative [Plasmodium berghei]|uniref:Regulator of chromosome condensation, putative n=2 Tax=Plasmodium berghei TaxID=5821 RepID=A0A509ALV8_PLABA|nr:regulator of chromosome condensation, putative [Plasmodium berghei ANKA]CXI41575.1 regulator of chromosome condensation, putative [Plasmodium berghei]SCM21939.1 regulator of chromosome condensation, putative [Plasmodium berghei]SCN25178.1 regulator of chromosome condensation, putative [Plasmodium berghei]SCO60180.1 regulator of chromosome condensation, putative [Plasmodium berghei]SCO61776.1 regulator of chromosome condensation, putative [Plasmodium berghei]|eukprot:XP_034421484.1 regulator of chromosome condensation, putative [Plasmodium berghei ANKA]
MGQGNVKNRLILHGTNEYLIDRKKKICFLNIRNNVKIKNIYNGPNNIIIIYENNDLEIAGLNNHGQLGLGDKANRNKLTINPIFSKQAIRKISCGLEHIIALMHNYNIFVWGNNKYGQLGIGDTTKEISTPLLVYFNEKVIDIACGNNHSIFLTESEPLQDNYTTNDLDEQKKDEKCPNSNKAIEKEDKINNKYFSNLDISINDQHYTNHIDNLNQRNLLHFHNEIKFKEKEEIKKTIEEISKEVKNEQKQTPLEKENNIQKEDIVCFNDIYSCGSGSNGKLGFKDEDNVYFPKKVDIKKKLKISNIYSSHDYNALLTNTGELYTWGNNNIGELNANNKKSNYEIKIKNFNNNIVIKASLGKLYSACLTKNNNFYIWGNNITGIKKLNLSNHKVKEFSCNDDNIIILTDDNKLFLLNSLKKIQYMNKLIEDKLYVDKKNNNSIRYNFIGNGNNYLYVQMGIHQDANNISSLKINDYYTNNLLESVDKQDITYNEINENIIHCNNSVPLNSDNIETMQCILNTKYKQIEQYKLCGDSKKNKNYEEIIFSSKISEKSEATPGIAIASSLKGNEDEVEDKKKKTYEEMGQNCERIKINNTTYSDLPFFKMDHTINNIKSKPIYGINKNIINTFSPFSSKFGKNENLYAFCSEPVIEKEVKEETKNEESKNEKKMQKSKKNTKHYNMPNEKIKITNFLNNINNSKQIACINDIDCLINGTYLNFENKKNIYVDYDFIKNKIAEVMNKNVNYIDYLSCCDGIINNFDDLSTENQNSFSSYPPQEDKYINLNIILLKELNKQKKINIFYSHVLNAILQQLNDLKKEKKKLKKKLSLFRNLNKPNQGVSKDEDKTHPKYNNSSNINSTNRKNKTIPILKKYPKRLHINQSKTTKEKNESCSPLYLKQHSRNMHTDMPAAITIYGSNNNNDPYFLGESNITNSQSEKTNTEPNNLLFVNEFEPDLFIKKKSENHTEVNNIPIFFLNN